MQINDLTEEHKNIYFCCLEDWSDEMKEAGDHKEKWYEFMRDKGLRVKIAIKDEKVCGMIQYLPVEHSFIEGKELYFIHCIWVHGYKKKGIGNYQKQGIGKALLQAAEEDTKASGAKGIAAWGISLPWWMKASWFKKQGYEKVDKEGMQVLMWKPFSADAAPPKWIREKKKPDTTHGKVNVTAFSNGWCPAMNITFERTKQAAIELGDKVEFNEIHTHKPEVFNEWGISDAIYIDGKQLRYGPPPSYQKLKKKIVRKVKKLKA